MRDRVTKPLIEPNRSCLISNHSTPLNFLRFFRRRLLSLSRCFLASELQKDLFETHRGGPQFVEFPPRRNHRASDIAAHKILLTFDLECVVAIVTLLKRYIAHSRNLHQALAHIFGFEAAFVADYFHDHGFAAASATPQIADRIRGHDLALVDDDDLFTGLLDFGENVCAENDRMIAGQALDQVARFIDLFRIETRGGLVKNQHLRIVNYSLGQSDPLAIPTRQFAELLLLNIRDGAPLANMFDALV